MGKSDSEVEKSCFSFSAWLHEAHKHEIQIFLSPT